MAREPNQERNRLMSTTDSAVGGAQNLWSKAGLSMGSILSTHLQSKVMNKADADGSGSLDQVEFKAAMDKASAKLGMSLGEDSAAMFEQADADADGALSGSELGQALQDLFMPAGNTQAFVQSRGDEQRFAELDADGDGNISKTEFGIEAAATMAMTTVTTVTTLVSSTNSDNPTGAAEASTGATSAATEAAATSTAAPGTNDALKQMLAGVDADADGQISSNELSAFVAQLGSQLELASRLYNQSTALGATGAATASA